MARIRRLSNDLINKIAAGEVVERPASVVKELVENAVDARATAIKVVLVDGGLGQITVIDDGHGMSREDAQLSVERHATSKLADEAGLFHIVTKGFRGEALPSIASVSRFELQTSEPGAQSGTRITIDGGADLQIEEVAAIGGTRFDIRELFFNVPARRKFLKRESTELGHCEEAVTRIALAHPGVAFTVEHAGKLLFSSPAAIADPRERIAAALGPEVLPNLLAIEHRQLGLTVTGFVASPEFTLPTARGLYTFVNHRYIRDRGLTSAVQRAFQDSLPPGRQPVAVIFIEVEPSAVDVNVHPQKLEVRFSDPRSIQEAVNKAITTALHNAPWRTEGQPTPGEATAQYAMAIDRFLARSQTGSAFLEQPPAFTFDQQRASYGTARPELNDAPPDKYFGSLKLLGDLGRRFWVCEGAGQSLVIIDPRAVNERVLLSSLLKRFSDGTLATEGAGLFSRNLELAFDDAQAILQLRDELQKLGIDVEPFGGDTVSVRRLPHELHQAVLAPLFQALSHVLKPNDQAAQLQALIAMAHAAVPDDARVPSHDEAHKLLLKLDEIDFSIRPKRHKVVVHEVPLLQLEAATAV